ncbi:MAG: rhodanese-like domain-containing protein [Desulfurivibrionaceae bacterium]
MSEKKLHQWIPFLLLTGLLTAAPALSTTPAFAAEPAAATASQDTNTYTGKVTGKSNKAKTISIEVKGKNEFVKFDDKTVGIEHAVEGEASIIQFELRGDDRFATSIKPKLASLPEGVKEIKSGELARLIALGPQEGKYLLIDSRPAPRYHEGHIPTAISIPETLLKEKGETALPAEAKGGDIQLIFYCGGPTCGMSTSSAGMARKMGYSNLHVSLEGIPGWKKSGKSVTASEKFVQTGNIVLVDLRAREAYEAGHIPKAHNIPLAALAALEDSLPLKAPTVVYADSPAEAEQGYKLIKKWGVKTISIWPGGEKSWTAKGNKLATGPSPSAITWARQIGKNEISLAEFKQAMEGNPGQMILDVRTRDEVQAGAFKNSICIPLDEIEKRLGELSKDKEMLIHCSTGARAEMAKAALDKAGIKSRFLVAEVECEQGKCVVTD